MTVLRVAVIAGALAWMAVLPISAYAMGLRQPAMEVAAALVYVIGSVICHQQPDRSFALAGFPWPVCARCTGLYAGAALSACVALVAAGSGNVFRSPFADDAATMWWRRVLFVSAIPTAVTLIYEWTTGIAPGNWMRALSAVPLGMAVCAAIVASFRVPRPRG